MAQERCECEATSILLFPCSGASNVGQIANAAAVQLTRQGKAKMYCLAGVGAHIPGMLDSARGAEYRIAIDGCATACACKALEHAGMTVDHAVIVTELGIKKTHEFQMSNMDIQTVMKAAMEGVGGAPARPVGACCCGCR